jgi:hypothetical protein
VTHDPILWLHSPEGSTALIRASFCRLQPGDRARTLPVSVRRMAGGC